MYSLAILSITVALRIHAVAPDSFVWKSIILLPILSRLAELVISGHGLDPSIRLHAAHHSGVFFFSLVSLSLFRWLLFRSRLINSVPQLIADWSSFLFLALSWYEKRQLDQERNGYTYCRIVFSIILGSLLYAVVVAIRSASGAPQRSKVLEKARMDLLCIVVKTLIGIMSVTGPSAAASMVPYTVQIVILFVASLSEGKTHVSSWVLAALLKLVTRHAFFSTNHGCAFQRLQLSAAFVATSEFFYEIGGISLFLNTFGWEMVGIMIAWILAQNRKQSFLMRIYCLYQLIEAVTSCLSVSVLRRHLMVWDVYAPHFLFTSIFTILTGFSQLTSIVLSLI